MKVVFGKVSFCLYAVIRRVGPDLGWGWREGRGGWGPERGEGGGGEEGEGGRGKGGGCVYLSVYLSKLRIGKERGGYTVSYREKWQSFPPSPPSSFFFFVLMGN